MQHGEKSFEVTAPRSRFREGAFGRLFPDLKPWAPASGAIGKALEDEMIATALQFMDDTLGAAGNSTLPAGYTYFGQFVDHDITLDTTPLSDAEADPNRLQNFRTPRLDLDSIYGQGPDAQPYLYEHTGKGEFNGRLRIDALAEAKRPDGTEYHDLPRLPSVPEQQKTALIGDPRNDENIIVAQVHLAFLRAHNALVDAQDSAVPRRAAFEAARTSLRWLYQWVVWNDYVARICDESVFQQAMRKKEHVGSLTVWEAGYEDVYNWKKHPFMPLEFSAAAYRFGHSLVRGGYLTNSFKGADPIKEGFATFGPVVGSDLRGGGAIDLTRVIQWDWFLQMTSSFGPQFPQVTRKFDTKLVSALQNLPGAPAKSISAFLAARNLVRGVRLQLPAGSAVAKLMGLAPIDLEGGPDALWFYILKEAELGGGEHLGQVGSTIVAATFAGLLLGDRLSFFNIEPKWTPDGDDLLRTLDVEHLTQDAGGKWTLPSIIRLSGLPIERGDFPPKPQPAPAGQP